MKNLKPPQPGGMVGHEVWIFDANHRVYEKPKPGRIFPDGGPIWREHWRKMKITKETRVAWWVHDRKFPKANPRGLAWSEEEIDDAAWVEDNRHAIARCCEKADFATLQQIAKLVDYKEQPKT